MSKHTPGPWLHGWSSPDGLTGPRCAPTVWLLRQDVPVQEPIHVGGRPVAWVLSTLSDERAEADARLIAAAPELLVMLKRARAEIIWWQDEHQCCPGCDFINEIDAAIAKAEGVSQ